MKKKTVYTNNREIYRKFNMLNFSSEVVLKNIRKGQVERILKNINSNKKVLALEKIGDYTVIKKKNPVNFNIYFKKKK